MGIFNFLISLIEISKYDILEADISVTLPFKSVKINI